MVAVPWRTDWKVKAPPLTGAVDVPVLPLVPVVLCLGLWLAMRLPRWFARLPWRHLLLAVALTSIGWGAALALVRGPSGLDRGLDTRYEYPAVVAQVDRIGVGAFVETFTDPAVLAGYPVHIEGHPLGAALLFVGLDRIGLGGAGGAALFLVVAGSTTVPAVLLAVREVAGHQRARRAAPFLVLAPAAIWMVTSADALYAAVGAWGTALVVLATSPRRSRTGRAVLALAGGATFGVGINLTYGLVPLLLVPVVVACHRRSWATLAGAAVGGAAVVAAFAGIGFWWFDGLAATRARYEAGIASRRPFAYFTFLGNPAAAAVALGPAFAVALARVRDRRSWLVAGAALAAVGVADLTGLSKAEVERIWLPFLPWLLVLTAGLAHLPGPAVPADPAEGAGPAEPPGPPVRRGAPDPPDRISVPPLVTTLLAAQVVVAVAAESIVRTLW